MSNTNPKPAQTVSIGLMRIIDGSNNPKPPSNSHSPINLINSKETDIAHGSMAEIFSMGMVSFMKPAIINRIANNTFTTYNVICILFEGVVIIIEFKEMNRIIFSIRHSILLCLMLYSLLLRI